MKKETLFGLWIVFIVCCAALASAECEYNANYDADSDYIMNKDADCGSEYTYDCDDSDKDTWKDCSNENTADAKSLWTRFVNWIKGSTKKTGNVISGTAVKTMNAPKTAVGSLKETVERIGEHDCQVTICWQGSDEVYCPYGHARCVQEYSDCRIIKCAEQSSEDDSETGIYTYNTSTETYETETYTSDSCTEEYHDCYDHGSAVICKGDFSRCDDAFDDCVCGTRDDTSSYGETAQADIDTAQVGECSTGVYVCERQVLTMSGDVAESKVTCKGTFSQCAMQYGGCQCGDSSLTDFPTKYIGTEDDENSKDAAGYWCDWKDRKVPCYMLADPCDEKRNTCFKSTGIQIICQGTFEYCSGVFSGDCLCGIEELSSGFMYGDEQ